MVEVQVRHDNDLTLAEHGERLEHDRSTVHLSFSGGPPAGEGGEPGDGSGDEAPNTEQIQEGLVTALESIKNFVEEGALAAKRGRAPLLDERSGGRRGVKPSP